MYEHETLRKIIPIGTRFGRLTTTGPVDFSDKRPGRGGFVACVCDCGGKRTVRTASLRNGRCQSCGCLQREAVRRLGEAKNKGIDGVRDTYRWMTYLPRERCDLCKAPLRPAVDKRPGHLDHEHNVCAHSNTSACKNCIRGVLCVRCNRDVGAFDRWGWPNTLLWYRDRRPLLTLQCSKDRSYDASC